jgi:hypothetical protein
MGLELQFTGGRPRYNLVMRLAWTILLTAVALAPGRAGADRETTFNSRVAYAPLVAKLKASGGDIARVLHPRSPADLAALAAGKRYKFVVTSDGKLAIAPLPADAARNGYVHPILAGGAPVLTAGGITVERRDRTLTGVTLDEDSKSYCPTLDSLAAAERALARIGIPAASITRRSQPPRCEPVPGGR